MMIEKIAPFILFFLLFYEIILTISTLEKIWEFQKVSHICDPIPSSSSDWKVLHKFLTLIHMLITLSK